LTLSAGARLGPYEILERPGSGGMGEVYRAKDTRLDRIVAIKVLSADPGASGYGARRRRRSGTALVNCSSRGTDASHLT
jgi:eukaryotic-like serine/threonine-protein kinase